MCEFIKIESIQGSRQTVNELWRFEDFLQIDFNEKTRKRKPRIVLDSRLSLNKLVKTNVSEAFPMPKIEENQLIKCACNCGEILQRFNSKGRERRFIHGHNGKLRPKTVTEEQKKERKKLNARKYYYDNYERLSNERKLNPKKLTEQNKNYYLKNREKEILRAKKYRTENIEKVKKAERLFKKNNRDKCSIWENKRRSRLFNAKGSFTPAQWTARVEYFGWKCRYCQIPLSQNTLTKDHLIPLVRGGTNWASNLVPSCLSCNCRKQRKTYFEFIGGRK